VVLYISLVLSKTLLEPGSFFAAIWTGFVWIHLLAAFDLQVSAFAVWFIVASVISVIAGSYIGGHFLTNGKPLSLHAGVDDASKRILVPKWLSKFTLFSIVVGVIYVGASITAAGQSVGSLVTDFDLVSVANELSRQRYSEGQWRPSLWIQGMLIAIYLSPILGGIQFALARGRRDRTVGVLSLFPVLLLSVIHTTRSGILIGVLFWGAAYISSRIYRLGHWEGVANPRIVIGTFVSIFILILIFGIGEMMRVGDMPSVEGVSGALWSIRTRATFFGNLCSFSVWFDDYLREKSTAALGSYTFSGIVDLLGLRVREQGLYGDEGIEVLPGAHVNIYTLFRGLIQDFGLVGTIVFLFGMGIAAGRVFKLTYQGNHRNIVPLFCFYVFSSYYVVSIFIYNSVIFACLTAAILMFAPTNEVPRARENH